MQELWGGPHFKDFLKVSWEERGGNGSSCQRAIFGHHYIHYN